MNSQEQLIDYLLKRIESIDEKVDKLLAFKWQIIGGSVVVSMVVAAIVQIAIVIASK